MSSHRAEPVADSPWSSVNVQSGSQARRWLQKGRRMCPEGVQLPAATQCHRGQGKKLAEVEGEMEKTSGPRPPGQSPLPAGVVSTPSWLKEAASSAKIFTLDAPRIPGNP